jgi:hypothetical protein
MIKGISDKHTINWVKRQVKEKVETVISPKEKSDTIYSLLAGVPAPMVVLEETGKSCSVLNGKDLIASIIQFIHGGFALEKNEVFEAEVGEGYVGKTYFDFSDDEKERFLDLEIFVNTLDTLTEIQRKLLTNSYTALQPKAVTQELETISCEADAVLEQFLNHKFFEAVNINAPSIDVVTQLLMVSEEGAVSELRVKDIIDFKQNLSKDVDMSKELDLLAKAYTEKTTYLKKTHLPMIYVCAGLALKDKVKPVKFREVMDSFFDNMSDDCKYKKACDSSTSKSKATMRIKELVQYYKDNK